MPKSQEAVVLLVDVDADIRDYMREVLEPEGFQCLTASGASEALAISLNRTERIDALLSGSRLGSDDGVQLADEIRRHRRDIAVLILSGTPRDAEAVVAKGYAFLAKPFLPAQLIEAVRSIEPTKRPIFKAERHLDFNPAAS